jgi:extracellular elastinolytic metalloproteinase
VIFQYHELTHGLTGRLIVGGMTCFTSFSGTQGYMIGEAYSDTISWTLTMKSHMTMDSKRVMGEYVSKNSTHGLRKYPYSNYFLDNPLTYASLQHLNFSDEGDLYEGAVFLSSIFYRLYFLMVQMSGFTEFSFTDVKEHGNTRFLELIVDSVKLLACPPTLEQVRSALLLLAKTRYDGIYYCQVWDAFAYRGYGDDAGFGEFDESYIVPTECIDWDLVSALDSLIEIDIPDSITENDDSNEPATKRPRVD